MAGDGQPASFEKLLRRHRLAAGLTQLALAQRAELSLRGFTFLERGARRPYPATAVRLADALGLVETARAAFLAAAHAEPPTPASAAGAVERPSDTLPSLPAALTSFVGRTAERKAILELLESSRLITLTGTGGVGKSRLAMALVEQLGSRYVDGVWLVELAPLAEAGLVAAAIAQSLRLREAPGRSPLDTLSAHLRTRRLLLLLDNCEHLVAACAQIVHDLLRAAPQLQILATSREPLAVAGEVCYRVPSLRVPDLSIPASLEQIAMSEAVRLFVARAQSAWPEFALDANNVQSVAAICARLDGIPLAIELAAARVGVLNAAAIAARLDARFALLTGGPRTALQRQQTLQATLDWSWALLSVPEQALLRRLTVFADGWTLAAAEVVCPGAFLPAHAVLDVLAALVTKSLVQVEEHRDEGRYTFLETVHHYARNHLQAAGEEPAWRDSHLRWSLALAEAAEPELRGGEQERWLARLETEHGNLRAALGWAETQGQIGMGLRLAGALWRFWYTRGSFAEGRAWYERLLEKGSRNTADADRSARAKALVGAASLACQQGDGFRAAPLAEASRTLYQEMGDLQGCANALTVLAVVARNEGDLQRARQMQDDILAIRRVLNDRYGTAATLHNLAHIHDALGDYPRARLLYEESLEISRSVGNSAPLDAALNTLNGLGYNAWLQGDLDRAEALCAESLAGARRTGAKSVAGYALTNLGTVALSRGCYDESRRAFEESLALRQEMGDMPGVAGAYINLGHVARRQGHYAEAGDLYRASLALHSGDRVDSIDLAECLQGLADVWQAQGHPAHAAWLLGVVGKLYATESRALPAPEHHADFVHITGLVRAALGEAGFETALLSEQTLSLGASIARALASDWDSELPDTPL